MASSSETESSSNYFYNYCKSVATELSIDPRAVLCIETSYGNWFWKAETIVCGRVVTNQLALAAIDSNLAW